ncbi:MFS transporter [Candidatus Roizmanbacteria bacterium CG_4_10_14_0_8_um_filter_39_9]|uniref:MFS transporter n=1 Tax=Candidatus Roizmanbacteria bacterium CG_4_10_14_0_8_um_filter_39_9 TaxID=1974829 RepID=A0A2M7QEQ8_9BACT|nr:MAG: MFS transporter [Candidatus Roizmanbacteria bacterium CG_4_10_14_0_8_um_filter_39_9]
MKNKPLFTIFAIVFVDLLGFGIILPLLPYIAERYNANPAQIGLLTAAYSFFQLLAAPLLGRLSDRYGRKKILIISQAGSAIGYLILALSNNLALLFVSRIIDGITGGNISIAQAYIADVTTKENRAKGMGMIGAAFGLGFIFGPAIGGLLFRFGYIYPALFAMVVGIITVFLTYFYLPETVNVEAAIHSSKTAPSFQEMMHVVFKSSIGYLIITFFILNTSFSVFTGNFALWTQHKFNFGPTENGFFFAYIGVLAVIMQLKLLPILIKKFGEKTLLRYSMIFLCAGLAFMPLVPFASFLFATQLLIVLGNSMANPSIQALASENVPKEEYGGTLGILASAGSLGRIIGPVIGGEIFYLYSGDASFYLAAALLFFVFLFLQVKLRKA